MQSAAKKPPVSQVILDKGAAITEQDLKTAFSGNHSLNTSLNTNKNPAIHEGIAQANTLVVSWCLKTTKVKMHTLNGGGYSPLSLAVQYKDVARYDAKKSDEKNNADQKLDPKVLQRRENLKLIIDHNYSDKYILMTSILSFGAAKNYDKAAQKALESGCIYYLDWYFNYLYPTKRAEKLSFLFPKQESNFKKLFINPSRPELAGFFLSFNENLKDIIQQGLPIHSAARYGDEEILNQLLIYRQRKSDAENLDPNTLSSAEQTALSLALEFYNENRNQKQKTKDMIKALTTAGAEWTSLEVKYALDQDSEILLELLEEYKILEDEKLSLITDKNKVSYQVFRYAIVHNKQKSIDHLIAQGRYEKLLETFLKNLENKNKIPAILGEAIGKCSIKVIKELLLRSGLYLTEEGVVETLIAKAKTREEPSESIINYLTCLQSFIEDKSSLRGELEKLKENIEQDYIDIDKLFVNIKKAKIKLEQEKSQKQKDEKSKSETERAEHAKLIEQIEQRALEGFENVVNVIKPSAPDLKEDALTLAPKNQTATAAMESLPIAPGGIGDLKKSPASVRVELSSQSEDTKQSLVSLNPSTAVVTLKHDTKLPAVTPNQSLLDIKISALPPKITEIEGGETIIEPLPQQTTASPTDEKTKPSILKNSMSCRSVLFPQPSSTLNPSEATEITNAKTQLKKLQAQLHLATSKDNDIYNDNETLRSSIIANTLQKISQITAKYYNNPEITDAATRCFQTLQNNASPKSLTIQLSL